MMMSFVEWLQSLIRAWRPWFTVNPWEQGVRIWRGQNPELLQAGMYLKVPILHTATVFPIRQRTSYAPIQTLRSLDGRTMTIGIVVCYRIRDLLLVLDTLHNPEGTLVHLAQGAVADLIPETMAADITPKLLQEHVLEQVKPERFGLADFKILISDNADLSQRTFRLINSDRYTPGESIEGLGRAQ